MGKWQIGIPVFFGLSCLPPVTEHERGAGRAGESFRLPAQAISDILYSVQALEGGQSVSECYPHALHSRHGPEGPQGPQGSHRPEGLDPSSPKQGGSEVDERDLWLLVGYC